MADNHSAAASPAAPQRHTSTAAQPQSARVPDREVHRKPDMIKLARTARSRRSTAATSSSARVAPSPRRLPLQSRQLRRGPDSIFEVCTRAKIQRQRSQRVMGGVHARPTTTVSNCSLQRSASTSLESLGRHGTVLTLNTPRNFRAGLGHAEFTVQLGPVHGWRCRARLAVRGRPGRPVIGLYRAGTHDALDIPDCRWVARALSHATCHAVCQHCMVVESSLCAGSGRLHWW